MSEEKEPSAEKRIIIDEDYKAQVQAEKEEAAQTPSSEKTGERPPLPEASLSLLLVTLATQALVALGFVQDPISKKTEPDFEQAKHLIDTLGILEEKTKGNLTPDEKRQLDSLLFDLRLQYVEASSKRAEKKNN